MVDYYSDNYELYFIKKSLSKKTRSIDFLKIIKFFQESNESQINDDF